MSEPKTCCNCLHCARWKRKDGTECHCDLTDKYLGYLQVMDEDNDCKHWEKETKWDLQREHDAKVRADVIEEYKLTLLEEFDLYEHKHGYPCMGDINEILNDTAEQMKEQKNV